MANMRPRNRAQLRFARKPSPTTTNSATLMTAMTMKNTTRAVVTPSSISGVKLSSSPGGRFCSRYWAVTTAWKANRPIIAVIRLRTSSGQIRVLVRVADRGSSPRLCMWFGEYGVVPYLFSGDSVIMCFSLLYVVPGAYGTLVVSEGFAGILVRGSRSWQRARHDRDDNNHCGKDQERRRLKSK